MCALAGRLAWESGFLVRVESSQEQRQKPRLEKPKRDLSIRQTLSSITHTHTSIFITKQTTNTKSTSPPRPASPPNALLLLMHLLDLSGRRNGRRFCLVLSWRCDDACAAIAVPVRSVLF
jgi:hypothetical protein